MKRKFSIFLSLCALLFSVTAMAQTEVKGTVVAEDDGNPIIGASIIVEGTNTGTVTDTEGNFRMTMPMPSNSKKIRVTYIGYETTTVTAKDGMRIVLKPRQTELDELIVTGYGNFKKASFTGSAQTLKTQALEDVPVVSIADKLAGGVAGVTVGSASSGPGGISSIRIRGMGSINAGNDPLIVIDGTPVQSGNISELGDAYNDTQTDVLSTLNTNDIESMTVIKDAAAVCCQAFYGLDRLEGPALPYRLSSELSVGYLRRKRPYQVLYLTGLQQAERYREQSGPGEIYG